MNKNEVSKYFLYPSLYVVFFVLGIILAIWVGFNFLYLLVVLMVVTILLVNFKIFRPVVLVVVFSVGSLYMLFFSYITMINRPADGCHIGSISSQVNQYSSDKYRFLVSANGQGRFVVETSAGDELGYGDQVETCISSENAKELDDGRENYYLSNYMSQDVYSEPQLKYLGRGRGVRRALFDFSNLLGRKFYRLWPGDKGVLAKGLLLGGSQDFSDEIGKALKNSGTSHLTAVSGYNVAIITVVVFNLLRLYSKRVAFYVTVSVLFAFVFLTGLTPSVMRAALMGGAYLVAKMLGRPKTTLHFLVLVGFILVLSNPFMVYNVGFLLSFVATYGLILAGGITAKIMEDKKGVSQVVLSTLGETIVAQIFVMPILLYYFGQVSVLAPVSNLLILPIIPPTMLFEFIALVLSFINFNLSLLLAKFIEPILNYVLYVIRLFGTSEYAVVKVGSLSVALVAGLYIILHLALWMTERYLKKVN